MTGFWQIITAVFKVGHASVLTIFKSFQFKMKSEDIIGLQISDLVAYPITRYVLDSKAVNPAYEVIKEKIYTQNGKMHGLKIHPAE